MALLCFLLDLRSLPSPLLRDLMESLLQLANLYAILSSSSTSELNYLKDRIGLCYVLKNGTSSPDDTLLEIAYSPRGSFNLRDFHRAVENLPTDAFIPEVNDSETLCCRDVKLSAILSDQVLYSWGGDVMRKVIVLSASAPYDLGSHMQKTLMEAADMHVSVEFVMFEQKSSHLNSIEENAKGLMRCISDIDSCSLKFYPPEENCEIKDINSSTIGVTLVHIIYLLSSIAKLSGRIIQKSLSIDVRVFQGLVKRWLQDLKDEMQEPLLVCFGFKSNLIYSMNQITCNLYMPVNQIIDDFSPCQTCRCHGVPLEDYGRKGIKEPSCAITGHYLETCNVIENSMKVGETTILFLPSYQRLTKLQQSSPPIKFDVIERTNLGTLSDSVIMGTSYVVVPSSFFKIESASACPDQIELNALAFQGLCGTLQSLDQGLVCLSNWNMETMKEATFPRYYILQPSCNGSMLLRRLAGSEEVLYVPDIKTFTAPVNKEIQSSIQDSLEKVELKDYNPLMHERGLHQKLNFLVKESLEFGLLTPKAKEATSEYDTSRPDSLKESVETVMVMDNREAWVAESWEQLVIHEFPETCTSVHVSKAKLDGLSLSLPDGSQQLAVKTSKILERLEVPRQRTKARSPNTVSSDLADTNTPTMPRIPFVPIHAADQGLKASQLMIPNFNKLKRRRT